jgi:hypothetical protein
MLCEMTLQDEDAGRDYNVTVFFNCRREIGGDDTKVCVDVDDVWLDTVVVWLVKRGCEVVFDDYETRKAWARHVEHQFDAEIRERCVTEWNKQRFAEVDE